MRTILVFLLASACGGSPATPSTPDATAAEPAKVAAAAVPAAAEASAGAAVFAQHCAACHGADGRGDGPAAAALDPAPADLAGPRAPHLKGIPRRQIIEEGRPGTAMVGWKSVLSPEDLDAVYGFVHDLKHPK